LRIKKLKIGMKKSIFGLKFNFIRLVKIAQKGLIIGKQGYSDTGYREINLTNLITV